MPTFYSVWRTLKKSRQMSARWIRFKFDEGRSSGRLLRFVVPCPLHLSGLDIRDKLLSQPRCWTLPCASADNPRVRGRNRTSENLRKAGSSQGKAFVPGHARSIPEKIKCAMRKINLVTFYAMRIFSACPTTPHYPTESANNSKTFAERFADVMKLLQTSRALKDGQSVNTKKLGIRRLQNSSNGKQTLHQYKLSQRGLPAIEAGGVDRQLRLTWAHVPLQPERVIDSKTHGSTPNRATWPKPFRRAGRSRRGGRELSLANAEQSGGEAVHNPKQPN